MLKPHEIGQMRAAGRFAAELLDVVETEIGAGMSTAEIDALVDRVTREHGAGSAPFGYHGFPAHCCTSINEVVCHGIPDARPASCVEGDIINVDVTPIVEGFHGDASRTFFVGEVNPIARRLVEDTYTSLWLRDRRGAARRSRRRHRSRDSVLRRAAPLLDRAPVLRARHRSNLPYRARGHARYGGAARGEAFVPGMAFTIEPMINLGDWRCNILDDGWTAAHRRRRAVGAVRAHGPGDRHGVEVLTVGAAEFDDSQAPRSSYSPDRANRRAWQRRRAATAASAASERRVAPAGRRVGRRVAARRSTRRRMVDDMITTACRSARFRLENPVSRGADRRIHRPDLSRFGTRASAAAA